MIETQSSFKKQYYSSSRKYVSFMWLSDYKNKRIERRRMLGTGSIATCIAICLPPWHQNGVWSSWIKSYFPRFI